MVGTVSCHLVHHHFHFPPLLLALPLEPTLSVHPAVPLDALLECDAGATIDVERAAKCEVHFTPRQALDTLKV